MDTYQHPSTPIRRGANLGYVRPEKWKVGSSTLPQNQGSCHGMAGWRDPVVKPVVPLV